MRLLFCCIAGLTVGYATGRFAQALLPTAWAIVIVSGLSISIWLWAFRTLRELSRKKRQLDDLLRRIQAAQESESARR